MKQKYVSKGTNSTGPYLQSYWEQIVFSKLNMLINNYTNTRRFTKKL